MIDAIKSTLEAFSRDPISFLLPTIAYFVFMIITLGAMIGVLLLGFFGMTAVGVPADIMVIVLAVVGAILILLYGVFSAGYKGSLVNEYRKALRKEPVGFTFFMKYAFKNCPTYFVIALVKIIIMGFLIMPFSLLYYFLDLGMTNEILAWLVILIALFIVFVVEFLFSFSFIAAAVKNARPITAIIISLNFIKETNINAFMIYVLYCMIVLATFVPLVDIIAYFIFYPVAYSSMIQFFDRKNKYGPY